MKNFRNKFLQCGILGWCLEILWTGFLSFRRRDPQLISKTSIWMFPIYGAGALLTPLIRKLRHLPILLRGVCYTMTIFLVEFTTGTWLKKLGLCPWDYSRSRYNVKGVIRLDYAPLWFCTGLLLEHRIKSQKEPKEEL